MPNVMAIGQTIVKTWQFMAIFKMAAVRHFGFYEFETFSTDWVERVSVRHFVKFHGDRSTHC